MVAGMARAFAVSRATATIGSTASQPSLYAAQRVKAASFLIDGEAVIARDDGLPVMLGNGRRRKSGQFGYLLTVCSKRPPAPF